MDGDTDSGSARPGPDHTSCSNVLIMALNEMWGETWGAKGWYTSTKELQLASLEFCIACRTYQTLHLNVDAKTPRRLLAAADATPLHPKRLCGTRVPRLRARSVTWNMPTAGELRNPIFAITDSDCLEFGRAFTGSLEAVAWPRRLKTIEMDHSPFNEPIDLVDWPASLERLAFGAGFNQPLERMKFPASLRTIVLSEAFNQPIDLVEFPASLRQLIFYGSSDFNQPIAGVNLPISLRKLDLGERFNQPIEDIVWPPSLQELNLGFVFDQPIEHVIFPSSLQELTVQGGFNQPIERVLWPDSLQRLVLGYEFNRPIDDVRWPASMQDICFASYEDHGHNRLTVYANFNQSIGSSVWPASLRRLTVGERFRQSLQGLGTWMPNLEALRLVDHRDHSSTEDNLLRGIEWPKGLRQLTVFEGSNLDGVTIPSVVQVDFPESM